MQYNDMHTTCHDSLVFCPKDSKTITMPRYVRHGSPARIHRGASLKGLNRAHANTEATETKKFVTRVNAHDIVSYAIETVKIWTRGGLGFMGEVACVVLLKRTRKERRLHSSSAVGKGWHHHGYVRS